MADQALLSLASQLEQIEAPAGLYRLARECRESIVDGVEGGRALAVHAILLLVARRLEGEPLLEPEWLNVRSLCRSLAEYLRWGNPRSLGATASAWCSLIDR